MTNNPQTPPAPSVGELIALLLRLGGHAQRLSNHPASGTAHTDALAALEAARALAAAQPAPAPAVRRKHVDLLETARRVNPNPSPEFLAEQRFQQDIRAGKGYAEDNVPSALTSAEHRARTLLVHPTPPAGAGAEAEELLARAEATDLKVSIENRSMSPLVSPRWVVTLSNEERGGLWHGYADSPTEALRLAWNAQAQAEGGESL